MIYVCLYIYSSKSSSKMFTSTFFSIFNLPSLSSLLSSSGNNLSVQKIIRLLYTPANQTWTEQVEKRTVTIQDKNWYEMDSDWYMSIRNVLEKILSFDRSHNKSNLDFQFDIYFLWDQNYANHIHNLISPREKNVQTFLKKSETNDEYCGSNFILIPRLLIKENIFYKYM